ncbi:RNA exonuclease 4 [Spathaspora sp. JA1]|nr:RNA exonuclease 4 [Spathaspora sp. JA1]
MAGLSSNWKKLSSKISKPETKKKPAPKKVIPKKVISAKVIPTVESSKSKTVTPIEFALWAKEHITKEDLPSSPVSIPHTPSRRKEEPGKYIAIDCEFVGVGPEGERSVLARVSLVNFYGHVLLDEFVKPKEKVTDWRTWVSGVTSKHMADAITFEQAQTRVGELLKDKVVVGHAVHHDLDALLLSHPGWLIRDTVTYPAFRKISNGRSPSLKKLTGHFLGVDIQQSSHSSVEDARATMLLFRLHKKDIEQHLRNRHKKGPAK